MKPREKGSVTIIVITTIFFLLIILGTIFTTMSFKRKSQLAELEQLKEAYDGDMQEIYSKYATGFKGKTGAENDPFRILSIEDLITFSNLVKGGENFSGKYIELTRDLNLADDDSYRNPSTKEFGDINEDNKTGTLKEELTTGKGFPAIGNSTTPFSGSFNGNDCTISNLYINNDKSYQGLFSYNNGLIKNLTVKGNIRSTSKYIGGIVGSNNVNGQIIKCDSKVEIIALQIIGGVAGTNLGSIGECGNYNTIESTIENDNSGSTGGIAGSNNGNITQCHNKGEVIAKSNCIGGIVGYSTGKVESCFNNAQVKSNRIATGGIVGFQNGDQSKTINCYNLKEITNNRMTGGIIGRLSNGQVLNCYSIGNITGASGVKSIIGEKSGSNVESRNNYYLATLYTSDENAIPKSDEEMKQQSFVELLNEGKQDGPWTLDTNGLNNWYPILKWQK